MRLLLWLILVLEASAAVLRVPADYPGVQVAMDASQAGDTVVIDRGVWTGLLESPAHTLLLCSNYPFTQDSADIAETILDGEYAGTILNINTSGEELLSVTGLTFWRGQGAETGNGGYCIRAGAIQMENNSSGSFSDIVVADCRGPRSVSVLFMGTNCSALSSRGSLALRRIHCRGNTITNPGTWLNDGIVIRARESTVIVDGFYWDGGGESTGVMNMNPSTMDSLALSNVRIVNCAGSSLYWFGGVPNHAGSVVRNIRSDGCAIRLSLYVSGIDSSHARIRNIEVSGLDSVKAVYINSNVTRLDMDSIHVHNNRMDMNYVPVLDVQATEDRGHVLRNLHFHDNVRGDSTGSISPGDYRPLALVSTRNTSILKAHLHDNRVILPGDPNIGNSNGNHVVNGGILRLEYGNLHVVDVTLENNNVDDFDDYSVYSTGAPQISPIVNFGREFWALADALIIRNLTVRNSRMDNPIPEITVGGLQYIGPGHAIYLAAATVDVEGLTVENVDDGGLNISGNFEVNGAIFRNVKRNAIVAGGDRNTKYLRNILIENTVGGPNWLRPEDEWLSTQSAIWMPGGTPDYTPTFILENVTVTGCNNLRHLINIWNAANLQFKNCLFYNNTYEYFVNYDDPIVQNWQYCITEDPVIGSNNQVGVDPLFDEELGAPWLSPISPAIDAGHPDQVYSDIEDLDNPGFALWPSQGALRNDIGYTGGPYAGTLEHLVAVRPPVTDRPTTLPQGFTLHPVYPNPFNPSTTVSYSLARPMQVELSAYNLLGQQVRTLAFGMQDAGEHSVPFTAGELASGVYMVELKAGGHSLTQKVLLLK
jgi:hypothetical protein